VKPGFLKKAAGPFQHLFWKMQLDILRACPPLSGLVFEFSQGALASRRVWGRTLLRAAAQAPRAVADDWRNKRENLTVLSIVGVPVTTRCTLCCDKCLSHMPDVKEHKDVPLDEMTQQLRALFSCADHICVVILSGGEAFLHPDLDEIIGLCATSGKVGKIYVPANGTVIPDARVLAALRDANATVQISKYPTALQPKVEALKLVLRENEIDFTHNSGLTSWYDTAAPGQRQEGQAKRRFDVCTQQLYLIYTNGNLHLCSKSAALMEEGFISDTAEDYIDMRAVCPAAFPGQLRALLKKRAVLACSYCMGYTYETARVPVAAQRKGD